MRMGAAVANETSGRRTVLAGAAMIMAGQILAIANDLVLRQSDPSDVALLVVLIVLSVFLLHRDPWARWTTIALAAAGGLLELASVVLLIVTKSDPAFWPAVDATIPALTSLHAAAVAFAASSAFALLTASVLISAVLDLTAAGMLIFARSVRSYFSHEAATRSA